MSDYGQEKFSFETSSTMEEARPLIAAPSTLDPLSLPRSRYRLSPSAILATLLALNTLILFANLSIYTLSHHHAILRNDNGGPLASYCKFPLFFFSPLSALLEDKVLG
jgi:hypothetical protein